MKGWRWALRPLILAGALALTTGAALAQQAATGNPASAAGAPVRQVTGERLTATLGAHKTTDPSATPTVAVDPSLGTVITFHGSPQATGAGATGTAPPAPSLPSSPTGAGGPTRPPARSFSVTAGMPSPAGSTGPASAVSADGPVWSYHGGRSMQDPTPTPPTSTGAPATANAAPTATPAPETGPGPTPAAPTQDARILPTLPMPSSMPGALPPLPPLPGNVQGALANGLPGLDLPPSGPTVPASIPGPGLFGAPVNLASPSAGPSDDVEDHWATLMQNEANHLTQESSVPMTVIVVRTRDEVMRRFIAQSIMHEDTTRYSEADSGLSALFSMGSRVNNSPNPTCYILFRRDKIGALRDQFLAPMSAKVGEAAAVAFVIGHETGHCLDYYERQRTFPTRGFWSSTQTASIGIAPAAAHRIFPNGMTPAAYDQAAAQLYGDLAQRQYEERIADVFGVMWAVHRGFPDRLFDDVFDARKWVPRNGDHATAPALVNLRAKYNGLTRQDFAHLWALARQVQIETGVNREVDDGVSADAAHFDGADKFYGPTASTRTPNDPTHGPEATVVGPQRVQVRPFGQAYSTVARPVDAPDAPDTVVGLPTKIPPKPFGGNSFGAMKAFGSSLPSGQ